MSGRLLLRLFAVNQYSFRAVYNISKYVGYSQSSFDKFNFPQCDSIRYYSKGKDRGGGGKNSKKGKVHIDANQLSSVINLDNLKEQMQAAVDKLKEDYTKHISVRTATGSIESITVTFEGKEYELQELSQVIRKSPKTIVLNMSSFPQAIPDVLKALDASGLNLNPQQDGTSVFVPVPKVTKEHREHLAKNAKVIFIKCRDAIKNAETDQLRVLKRKDGISEDLMHDVRKQIIALSDTYITQAKQINIAKHNELLKD